MELRKGDILLFKWDKTVSNIISSIAGYWSHSGKVVKIVENDVYIQEANGGKLSTNVYDIFELDSLYCNNRLMLLDFGLNYNLLNDYVNKVDGKPYDYLSIFRIFMHRIGFKLKIQDTSKYLFCSEDCARCISECSDIDVLRTLNLKSYEQITPEHLCILYVRYKNEDYFIK